MTSPPAGRRRVAAGVALLLILAAGGALRLGAVLHHARVDYDEGRYLDLAVHLIDGDGFLTSTVSHYFGDPPRPPRPEDFSSPLYPLLLAGLFLVSSPSFLAAKLASVAAGLAAIPLVYLLGRRLFGPWAGLIAAAGIALQPDQILVGAWAMTEPLYLLLLAATLLLAAPLAAPEGRPVTAARAALLGLLCGLLYLVRQNGLAVAAALGLLILLGPLAPGEGRLRRLALLAVTALVTIATCAPWLARNAAVFGSPTFTRMSNIAWAEHGRSLYTPGTPPPSMERFLEEHGTAGLAANLARRAGRVTQALFLAETGPFRWLTWLAFAAPLVPRLRAASALVLPAAILSAALFLGVAPWSGAIPRYLLPIRPLLYAAGAAVAIRLLAAAAARLALPAAGRRAAAGVIAVALLAWAAADAAPVLRAYHAADQASLDRLARDAAEWIAANTAPGDVILEGGLLHQYAWLFRRGVVWIPYGDLGAALDVADRYDARWIAVSPEVLRFRPDLARHWTAEGRRIEARDLPPGLEPVYDRSGEGLVVYAIGRRPPVGALE